MALTLMLDLSGESLADVADATGGTYAVDGANTQVTWDEAHPALSGRVACVLGAGRRCAYAVDCVLRAGTTLCAMAGGDQTPCVALAVCAAGRGVLATAQGGEGARPLGAWDAGTYATTSLRPGMQTTATFAGGQRVALAAVRVGAPPEQRREFTVADRPALEPEPAETCGVVVTPTPRGMVAAAAAMLRGGSDGPGGPLYVEAKALELLALHLAHAARAGQTRRRRLSPADVARVRAAGARLTRALDQPPSLVTLARQVGTNDHTLKRGFRAVFGTTVFGYLRAARLEHARMLLRREGASVGEAARTVGYANASQFAAAYRRHFGTAPHADRDAEGKDLA